MNLDLVSDSDEEIATVGVLLAETGDRSHDSPDSPDTLDTDDSKILA